MARVDELQPAPQPLPSRRGQARQDAPKVRVILGSGHERLHEQHELGDEIAHAVAGHERRLTQGQAAPLVPWRDPGVAVVGGHREVQEPG